MTKSRSTSDSTRLELDEDLVFQKHELLVRRVGTALLAVFLGSALLGLFGSGPLSDAELHSGDGALSVRFERLTRHHAAAELHVAIRSQSDSSAELRLNRAFGDAIEVEDILPQPARAASSDSRHVYHFVTAPPDSITRIVLRYRPLTLGWTRVVMWAAGHELRFRYWVYP